MTPESLLDYLAEKFKPYYDGPNEGWSLEIIQLLEPLWSKVDIVGKVDEVSKTYSHYLTEYLPINARDDFFDYVLCKEPVWLLIAALVKDNPFTLSDLFEQRFDGRWAAQIAASIGEWYPDTLP